MKSRFAFFLIVVAGLMEGSSTAHTGSFAIEKGRFFLNGQPFQIISGELHYARIPPEYWRDRLLKARAMGLNTVATYVFWNVHEPAPSAFNFSGPADVARFVRLAQDAGLRVIIRPGPYACAEWDFGGFPAWLLRNPDLKVRTVDTRFLDACRRYLARLGRELAPLQITRGGPIIMVQVENEYGSFGRDTTYCAAIRDMIRDAGFEVPLFAADGPSQMANTVLHDVLPAVNGALGEEIFTAVKRYRADGPFFVPEFYPGWLDHWGEPHSRVDADTCARDFDWILSHGISVSIYMFHGGTNFGFMSGANYGGRYQPQPTSYDYDAPLDEAGRPTLKYFKLREAVARHIPDSASIPFPPAGTQVIGIPPVHLEESAELLDALPAPIRSPRPLAMEDLGESYGYIVYRAHIAHAGADSGMHGTLRISGLRDYAVILLNGRKVASLDRRHRQRDVALNPATQSAQLDIVVENAGRINFGHQMQDNRKGIIGTVTFDGQELTPWEIFPLPMNDLSLLRFSAGRTHTGPAFYRGSFALSDTGDTFLDMRGWGKGCVWVNGHNLGRFWSIGPQQTLYLPGAWLNRGNNDVIVLELENKEGQQSVQGLKDPILDQLGPDPLKPPAPHRARGSPVFDSGDLAGSGTFGAGDSARDFFFPPVTGRYVCLESLSSQARDHFASIAEFFVLDDHRRALPRDRWHVAAVDCEEVDAEDGRAENAFDGDPETIWHTLWSTARPDHPHWIVIDCGRVEAIGGIRYLPRQGNAPGKIKDFKIYVRRKPLRMTE